MEFTIDFDLVRRILKAETEQVSRELTTLGALPALNGSLSRMDQRLAEAGDAQTLACKSGCDWCCHFTIDVRPVEALNIAAYMQREFTSQRLAQVRNQIDINAERLALLDDERRVQQNTRCPFLVEHRCSIYAVRPQTCRNYHATDVAGCKQSFEEPHNVDIDPEFAPLVYQSGQMQVEVFTSVLQQAGRDMHAYELNAALAATLADLQGTQRRFDSGDCVFPDIEGLAVEPELMGDDEHG